MLIPYLKLSDDERIIVVQRELAEGRHVLTELTTTIDGRPATILACKEWGVIVLGNRLIALGTYPLIQLDEISTGPEQSSG